MKKTKFLSLCLLVVTAFNFISCSGDVEPLDPAVELNPNPPAGSFFKVDFSGQTFEANTTVAYVASGNILISGVKSSGQTISIALDGATVGTYNTDTHIISYSASPNSEYDYVNFNELPDGNYVSNGTVVITEINMDTKMISGTFAFTGHWSDFTDENPPAPIEFTNGSFKIPFTSSGNPVEGDSFTAKVNGAAFVGEVITTAYASSGESAWITINGKNTAQNSISININDDAELGTHAIVNEFGSNAKASYQIGNAESSDATSGSLTIISKTDDRIKGTFQFTAVTGQAITEGAFDVEY
ncbi:DUF6252 family protein [Flavobacterium sp. PLA-1-15]|uniref:DUF6252 family protein n=1 Tax=Flavobacterium sp. PLA-1-15 TaxID=3380533 RepID=UPI003B77CC93